jgi:CubicO group peptidase (beta-lactamase class C family)
MKIFLNTLLVLFLFISTTIYGQLSNAEKIDAIMERYASSETPGASVLIMQGGKIIFKKGYGVANISSQEKITPTTNFRLASVTKQFTATTILMLEQQKKLSLDDPLTKYFSSFPDYGKKIKIKHLLTHSSGLVDYEDLIPPTQTTQVHDTSCLQLMYMVDSLYFPAGTQYKYSNTGYAILALVVEKVTGKDFATYLKETIFKPLGMKNTIAFEAGKSVVINRAIGHSYSNGSWTQTDQNTTSAVLGDGGVYSNVIDLSKWIKALMQFKLMPTVMQNRAWSRSVLDNGKPIDYGYGWHIEEYKNITHPFHGGSSIGFRNCLLVFPNQQLMVVILSNRNQHEPIEEAQKIASLFLP